METFEPQARDQIIQAPLVQGFERDHLLTKFRGMPFTIVWPRILCMKNVSMPCAMPIYFADLKAVYEQTEPNMDTGYDGDSPFGQTAKRVSRGCATSHGCDMDG